MTAIRPGARVVIRFDRHPPTWYPCHRHLVDELPLKGAVGVVDRIATRFSEHNVIVVFKDVHVPPFGEAWVDAFRADELVLVEG